MFLLTSLREDVRWSIRSLRKHAGFTALALGTLTLGIGATSAAFAVFDTVLLRPLPFRDAGQLLYLSERTAKGALRPPSYPNFVDWRTQTRSFDGVVSAQYPYATTVTVAAAEAAPQRLAVMGISRHFLRVLGVRPVIGREFTDDENTLAGRAVVMVSYEFWQSRMGGRLPLGDIVMHDASQPVVGVMPPGFRFLSPADVYFPLEQRPGTMRSAHNYMVVARLAPNSTARAAHAEMTTLARRLKAVYGDDTEAVDVELVPLGEHVVGRYRTMLRVVFAASLLVLLIACANLLSAQLARGWTREREIAIRAALGASRMRLVRQLCIESVVLVTGGALLGTGAAVAFVHVIKRYGVDLVPRLAELGVDARVVSFVVAAMFLTVLLIGVYPALRLSARSAPESLRATRTAGSTIRASVWRGLIGFESGVAVLLLVGSLLLVRTMRNILASDVGFDPHGIVTAAVAPSEDEVARIPQIIRDLASLPGTDGVAFTNRLPLSWGNGAGPVRRPSDPLTHDWPAMAGFRVVTPRYFSVLRQPVVRGRAFSDADRAGAPGVAIITTGITETLWPGQDPIGKIVATNYLFDQWLTVVGVVAEASSWAMPRGTQNEIFVPLAQHPKSIEGQLIAVVRTTTPPASLVGPLRARLRQLLPHSPATFSTIDESIAESAADRRFAMLALSGFGVVALLLAGVGIYGVMWYGVTTRTREIGIRMALGASPRAVGRDVLASALMMSITGTLAGIVVAVFATRYLQATLYGVDRSDVSSYAVSAAMALIVAAAGAFLPARRSTKIDPMEAMRTD